jgi:hypothetical protein
VIEMRRPTFLMPSDWSKSVGAAPTHFDSQLSLLPTRISTIYPNHPTGKHIKFLCTAVDGLDYHCKADADGRPTRATEWIAQSVALHLGIAVPEFRVMEDKDGDETLFGSRNVISTAGNFEVRDYLTRKKVNEFGGPTDWFGRRLSGLYALDMFLNNPDRGVSNFVLEKGSPADKLSAIDFADAHLEDITSDRFPVATSNTVCNGKFVENVHGFFLDSAMEMIEKIRLVPASVIEGIIGAMPDDWMAHDQKIQLCAAWADNRLQPRLSALRAGLEDGSRR